MKIALKIIFYFLKYSLAALGIIWLLIEPIFGLSDINIDLSYIQLIMLSIICGTVFLLIDGIWLTKYFRPSIEINNPLINTKLVIKFGDIFKQKGWKAIAVNDFFDSLVDDQHISSTSLHGILLKKFLAGNTEDWDKKISDQISSLPYEYIDRSSGKKKRFNLGTTAKVKKDTNKFLCFAAAKTNIGNLETKATPEDMIKALKGLLQKARSVCANEPLNIPLVGSGLSRVGLNNYALISLILIVIFEETKLNRISNEIRIILPKDKIGRIDISTINKMWN